MFLRPLNSEKILQLEVSYPQKDSGATKDTPTELKADYSSISETSATRYPKRETRGVLQRVMEIMRQCRSVVLL